MIDKLTTRPATRSDLTRIVRLHQAAFPGFFMTLLGPRFLASYYDMVLEFQGGYILVAENGGELLGFVAGFLDSGDFYRKLRDRRIRLLPSLAARLVLRPWLLARLWASYRHASSQSRRHEAGTCEISSIAVRPDQQGRGVGKHLVLGFLQMVRDRAVSVTLLTDTDGNEAANRFYTSLGFQLAHVQERPTGRRMNEYTIGMTS